MISDVAISYASMLDGKVVVSATLEFDRSDEALAFNDELVALCVATIRRLKIVGETAENVNEAIYNVDGTTVS